MPPRVLEAPGVARGPRRARRRWRHLGGRASECEAGPGRTRHALAAPARGHRPVRAPRPFARRDRRDPANVAELGEVSPRAWPRPPAGVLSTDSLSHRGGVPWLIHGPATSPR